MSFASPLFLLALLAVPLLVLAAYAARRRATRYAIRFPATGSLALAAASTATWRRHVPAALALAALAALALALAKPQRSVAVPIQGSSVMLVTDHSGSMAATDVSPDRLSAAVSAAESFLDRTSKQTKVGVVTYSDGPDSTQQPTTDRDAAKRALEAQTASGRTATGDALQAAIGALQTSRRASQTKPPAAIVLLSDGESNVGSDPTVVAGEAKRLGIPISTVALGTADGTIPDQFGNPQPVPPDPETLQAIARISGGHAFSTGDSDQLTSIYKSLGQSLSTKHVHREMTSVFAAAGLFLLLGAGLSSTRLTGRLPA